MLKCTWLIELELGLPWLYSFQLELYVKRCTECTRSEMLLLLADY